MIFSYFDTIIIYKTNYSLIDTWRILMKLEMDKIIFESRLEIDTIIKALEESKEKDNDTVKELIEKLDAMYMSW